MIRWIPYTFVRTVLFFAGGIVLGMYAPDALPNGLLIGLVVAGLVVYFFLVFARARRFCNPGWVGLPLVFLLGYVHVVWQTESRHPDHLLHIHAPVSDYEAVVTGFPEVRASSWRMEAKVLRIHTPNGWQKVEGRIMLYLSRTDFPDPFDYGDVLAIRGAPEIPDAPANPGEFDYREYLQLRNIYHVHFVRGNKAVKIRYDPPSPLTAFAFRARHGCAATLDRFIEGERAQGIASALVLGITDGLDVELLNAYAATGSMHILAVSGLHVSILYFILLRLLLPLKRLPGGRWLVPMIALLVMWFYAFITALSPSVLRSVTMFSFLAISRPWAKNTNVYNTLAVSAFCLLLFDPFLLRSVGFQLSYVAVLGIVYLYPRIVALLEPKTWLMSQVWKLSAVSLSAQLATFSLGLLYFHQFPNLFLLSNLVAVPLSSLVLIGGVLLLAISVVPIAAAGLGFCLGMLISFLNGFIFAVESVPFSLAENIYISGWQCLLLFLFVLTMIALAGYRKFSYMIAGTLIMVLYTGLQWRHFVKDVDVRKLTVYKIPGHGAIDLMDRGHTFFLTDSLLRHDAQKLRYHVTPNRLIAGIDKVTDDFPQARSFRGGALIVWAGKSILYINGREPELPKALSVDLLIIGNNAVREISVLAGKVSSKKVILDSSNSFFFASRFLEAAKLYKLDVYSVLHQGAFVSTIENPDA